MARRLTPSQRAECAQEQAAREADAIAAIVAAAPEVTPAQIARIARIFAPVIAAEAHSDAA